MTNKKQKINDKNIEYIIYCRKSTDEKSEHQKQSIPDQIKACIEYAEKNWIKIAKRPEDFSDFETEKDLVIEDNDPDINNRKIYQKYRHLFIVRERESAKEPFKRPKRRKIIEWIKKWKIKWILSYSPDRQARNLLEAWELIDLVDKWLVNLKYTNFHFENNASWKMMLWIWFVFSKQYSDKLSEDITRWNLSAFYKWKALWIYKWWYKINKDWFHEPDWKNFKLLREAFHKRIYWNYSIEDITKRLNAKGFYRETKKWKKEKITRSRLAEVFKDTFYYWKFIYWWESIDLIGINPHFEPLISEEEYALLIEKTLKYKKIHSESKKRTYEFNPYPDWFVITEDGYKMSFYYRRWI